MTSRGRQEDRKGRTAAPASSLDSQAKAPGLALPTDIRRSLRLLDDGQLDRLMKDVTEEVRRRGRDQPDNPSGSGRQTENLDPTGSAVPKQTARNRSPVVTPGQERLILAAFEAGLTPAAIAREFRLSRPAVQHVITAAQRGRLKTER